MDKIKNILKSFINELKWYRIIKYILGMTFIAIGVSFMLKSDIGNSSWDTLHWSMQHLFGITFGTATIIVATIFLILVVILNNNLKYILMAIPIFVVGPLIDITNGLLAIEAVPGLLIYKILYFIAGLTLLPLGGALLLISTYPAGVFDEFNMVVVRKLKLKSLVPTRVIMELTAVMVAAVLGYFAGFTFEHYIFGKIGIGTIIFAIFVGVFLKFYLKLFERIGLDENQQND